MPNKPKRPVLAHSREGIGTVVYPFSEEEYKKGIAALKNGKAASIDYVLVEQLKNLGTEPAIYTHNPDSHLTQT